MPPRVLPLIAALCLGAAVLALLALCLRGLGLHLLPGVSGWWLAAGLLLWLPGAALSNRLGRRPGQDQ